MPLAARFPALFSHYIARATLVRDVMRASRRDLFQRRLTPQASVELDQLSEMLQEVTLGLEPDERPCFFEDGGHRLVSRLIYKASTRIDHDCAAYNFV